MQASDFRVIEHGRSFDAFLPTGAPPQAGSPVRILVPGNISFAKGAELIRAMAALDGGRRVEFHILGDHGALQAMPGLILHGRYTRDAFLGRVAEIAPHLGAVFSIWPETYCHTLTELWASGLPVFALDTGAVGERIHAHGAGWLTTSQDPAELLEIILAAVTDEADFVEKLAQVRAWQTGHGTERDLWSMAADYDVLYQDVIQRRLVFLGGAKTSVEIEEIMWANDDYNTPLEEQISGIKPFVRMSAG
jgi:glycosyltransferase involved in cell wall biosynthesis